MRHDEMLKLRKQKHKSNPNTVKVNDRGFPRHKLKKLTSLFIRSILQKLCEVSKQNMYSNQIANLIHIKQRQTGGI